MSVTKAARRYAQSLLDVANEQKATKQVLDDCTLIAETVGGSRELQLFLKSPIIKSDKKLAALNELFFKKNQLVISSVYRHHCSQKQGRSPWRYRYGIYSGLQRTSRNHRCFRRICFRIKQIRA